MPSFIFLIRKSIQKGELQRSGPGDDKKRRVVFCVCSSKIFGSQKPPNLGAMEKGFRGSHFTMKILVLFQLTIDEK